MDRAALNQCNPSALCGDRAEGNSKFFSSTTPQENALQEIPHWGDLQAAAVHFEHNHFAFFSPRDATGWRELTFLKTSKEIALVSLVVRPAH